MKASTTQSISEHRFGNALEAASGITFVRNIRPVWLLNPVTRRPMELDLFSERLKIGIEYDGPQHSVYPNPYHNTFEEFLEQQARDVAKDSICIEKGIRLIRVSACVGDIADQVRDCMERMGLARPPVFAEDDASAGRLFLETIAPVVRSCNGRVYVLNGVKWTGSAKIVDNILLAKCLGANIVKMSASGGDLTMSGNVPGAKRIVTAAKAFMPDDPEFEDAMWRSNIGVVCFKNGVYDFRKRAFFDYSDRPDVFPKVVVPRDFPRDRPPQALMDEVRARLLLSTLVCPDVVETYLQLMARATAGEYADNKQQWVVMLGERNCGKGLLQEMNANAWGPYVNTINANSFLLQQASAGRCCGDAAKALSWALDCEYARQTYTNEVKCDSSSRSVKLDGNLLKSFQSGGDKMNARKNYENEHEFRVATKLIMNLNDMPDITPRDAVSTLVLIKFPFKFVAAADMLGADSLPFFRLRDDTLKTDFCRRPDVIDAFTWLILDAYRDNPVVPCASVREDTGSYREDIGDDLVVMTRCFKITKNRDDFVTFKDLKAFLAGKNVTTTVAKDRLKKMGGWPDDNCCVKGIRYGRGILGVQMIHDRADESNDSFDF